MLIVICGPTATGKSDLAIAIAQKLNSIIIGADSRQIYREFDIGTAKPTPAQRLLVPHRLIDICQPEENFTLAEYQTRARQLIRDCQLPLLVGGTGLYIKSIVRGLKIPAVPPQPQLRSQLFQLDQTYLYSILTDLDPIAAAKISFQDQTRTVRALEVYYVTGVPISQQQGENPPDYPILQIGLDCEKPDLNQLIARRTHRMIERGLVEEVEHLINRYGADLPLLNTLGYAEIKQYLEAKISLVEAIELTVVHTRQFAKRQRTWFRADKSIQWFDAQHPQLLEQVWQQVEQFINNQN